jgi:hypothetical protein
MSDTAGDQLNREEPRQSRLGGALASIAIAGLVSGVLYLSTALAPLYLVPVQFAYGRSGRRGGAFAAGASAALIIAAQTMRLFVAKSFSLVALGTGIIPPMALLGALILVNAGFWSRIPATYRILAVAAACALAAVPAMGELGQDSGFAAYMESRLNAVIAPIRNQAGELSYDESALAAALDPKTLVATTLRILTSSYGAMIVLMLGGSWWLGNRAAGPGSPGRAAASPLAAYRVPYALVWAFLASWTVVLATLLTGAPAAIQAAAWNCALALSLTYAAQGVGIASNLFDRWKMPRFTRVAIAATALVALVTPTAGIVVAVALPLLGVTEVWIPYRNPKGVGA